MLDKWRDRCCRESDCYFLSKHRKLTPTNFLQCQWNTYREIWQ